MDRETVLAALRDAPIVAAVKDYAGLERSLSSDCQVVFVLFGDILSIPGIVDQIKAAGRTVIMLGDGINDSPALSAADVGIAISDGAAIAREIADITIAADSLRELVVLKSIANGLQKRTRANYRFIMSFNSALIVLGAMGVLPPATSALLHNASTLGVSLKSMTKLLG